MQDATIYAIRKIGRRKNKGSTLASVCTINAILKFDGPESPHCVYSEFVALKLAQTFHIPVADGVVVSTGAGQAYASLEVTSPGIDLPDLLRSQFKRAASLYPDKAAALVAFDLWIGNRDREENLKASLVTPHVPLFRGFDHSHTLLNIESSATKSIERLRKGELIVDDHPFYKLVTYDNLRGWVDRIASLPSHYIDECCKFGRSFRNVDERVQARLARALDDRRHKLYQLIDSHTSTICGKP